MAFNTPALDSLDYIGGKSLVRCSSRHASVIDPRYWKLTDSRGEVPDCHPHSLGRSENTPKTPGLFASRMLQPDSRCKCGTGNMQLSQYIDSI